MNFCTFDAIIVGGVFYAEMIRGTKLHLNLSVLGEILAYCKE